jgi:hypothetical protein
MPACYASLVNPNITVRNTEPQLLQQLLSELLQTCNTGSRWVRKSKLPLHVEPCFSSLRCWEEAASGMHFFFKCTVMLSSQTVYCFQASRRTVHPPSFNDPNNKLCVCVWGGGGETVAAVSLSLQTGPSSQFGELRDHVNRNGRCRALRVGPICGCTLGLKCFCGILNEDNYERKCWHLHSAKLTLQLMLA